MVHTGYGRVVAARDVDHVTTRVGREPDQIAGVVVAELLRAHHLILDHDQHNPGMRLPGRVGGALSSTRIAI
jgi:hypothetical protein